MLQVGQIVQVLEVKRDKRGRQKVRHEQGWTPMMAPDGRPVLEPADVVGMSKDVVLLECCQASEWQRIGDLLKAGESVRSFLLKSNPTYFRCFTSHLTYTDIQTFLANSGVHF